MKIRRRNPSGHLELVASLTEQLLDRGITAYLHTYGYLAFGSWEIVVGGGKRRLRIRWNSKKSELDSALCDSAKCQLASDWKPVATNRIEASAILPVFQIGYNTLLQHCATY